MGAPKTYSSKLVLISLGSHAVTGYADDSFITIAKNGDGISKVVGCDGEVARSIDPDNSYQVTIQLLQQSPTNKFLQQGHDKDYATGDGTFPILIKDLKGGVVFQADTAWTQKPADREYGKAQANRSWVIDTGEGTLIDS